MISSRSKSKNTVASLSAYVSGGAYLGLPENRFIEGIIIISNDQDVVATGIMGNKEPSEPRTRFDQVSNRALGSCGSSLTAIPVPIAIASISPKHLASWCNCEGPQMAERRSLNRVLT